MRSKAPSALRTAREWRGFTIRALQAASGVSTGRLSMLERNMVKPSPLERERLAFALGITVEELFPIGVGAPAAVAPAGVKPPFVVA